MAAWLGAALAAGAAFRPVANGGRRLRTLGAGLGWRRAGRGDGSLPECVGFFFCLLFIYFFALGEHAVEATWVSS